MKRILKIRCKDADLQVNLKAVATADGSNYQSDEKESMIRSVFDALVKALHEQFYYDEIKIAK